MGVIHLKEINKCVYRNSNFFYYSCISLFLLCMPVTISIFLNLKIHDGLRYFIYIIPLFNIIPSIFLYYLYKEFGSLKNIGGIYWGCRTNDYLQFSSWIFHTLNFTSISYDSSSQGGYSSLMWIQLLYKCFISPSVDYSAIK